MSEHVVMYSGGIGSYVAARRVIEKHGADAVTLLFCDTLTEHADTYRFMREGAAKLGARLVELSDGRDIWQVFRDRRWLGTARLCPASVELKQEAAGRWVAEHFAPDAVTLYVGIDWTEIHRYERLVKRRAPWHYEAPLCEKPYLTKDQMHAIAASDGLEMQVLYKRGAAHANCGGGCVRMGQGGFARLLAADRATFLEWERKEQEMRDFLGKNVAILRDRSGGTTKPLTLRKLRERIEGGGQCDMLEIGGCGCFVDEAAA